MIFRFERIIQLSSHGSDRCHHLKRLRLIAWLMNTTCVAAVLLAPVDEREVQFAMTCDCGVLFACKTCPTSTIQLFLPSFMCVPKRRALLWLSSRPSCDYPRDPASILRVPISSVWVVNQELLQIVWVRGVRPLQQTSEGSFAAVSKPILQINSHSGPVKSTIN